MYWGFSRAITQYIVYPNNIMASREITKNAGIGPHIYVSMAGTVL